MCKSTDEGGKRCAAHMSGSLAAVTMASIISGIKEDFVRKVFSALNKEGKHLPMPSEEEIVAFARNNQFISRHDVTIPENKRAMLVKRWQKAEMERPSGGTFHAWKHTMVESIVRWRRSATVFGIGSVLAFTSACSGGTLNDNSPAPTNSPTSISQSADPSVTNEEPAGPIPTDFGVPAPAGKKVESPNGSYIQSTISDDDPAMKLDPALVHSSLSSTDPAELESAQKFIVKFTAEEGIDSRLNGDSEDPEGWWAEHKSKIAPEYQDTVYNHLKKRESFVLTEAWQKNDYQGKYDYRTSPNKTRIYDRSLKPKVLWSPAPGSIAVEMDVSYKIPVKPNVGVTGTGVQTTKGTMSYAVAKDAQGNWVITGYQHKLETIQG